MDKQKYNQKRQEKRRVIWIQKYQQKMSTIKKQPTDILAYTAGLIDGEGCIYISKGKPRGARLNSQYTLKVAVGMSVATAVKKIQHHFGGALRERNNRQYKPIHRWELSSVEAERFLRRILPYLIVKKEEAVLGLEFREHMNGYIRTKGRTLTVKEIAVREAYKLKMEELKRG